MTKNTQSIRDKVIIYLVATLVILLMVFEILFLIIWVPAAWNSKLSAVMAIIGVYGLTTAFVSKIRIFKEHPEIILNDLISPNIIVFLASHFRFFGYIFMLYGNSLSPKVKAGSKFSMWFTGGWILILLLPVLFIYFVIYMIIVLPTAYLPVVLVSAVVSNVEYSSQDSEITITDKQGKQVNFILSHIILDDPISAKAFLIGVPSIVLSLYSNIAGIFISV